MSLVTTDAVVLHVFDYLESSRILRLATREAGVQSVLARGARRSRSRFGQALDLFASGTAHLSVRPGRDLQTLSSFEVARARPELAADLGRFTGANAIAELALRFVSDDSHPAVFETIVRSLDQLAKAAPSSTRETALAAAWRLVSTLGFAPALDRCSACHLALESDAAVTFSHPAGGALCVRCARLSPGGRTLPASARVALRSWLAGSATALPPTETRAHQRLLREFVLEHLADGRALRAFEVWEHAPWSPA